MKKNLPIGVNLFFGIQFSLRFFLYMYLIRNPTSSFEFSYSGWHYDAIGMLLLMYVDCFITVLVLILLNLKGYSEARKKNTEITLLNYFFGALIWSVIPVGFALVGGLVYGIL